jgi:hypothetical protein
MIKAHALALAIFALAGGMAHAADTKATLAQLDERLNKFGAPRIEGTAKTGDKDLPAIFFGPRRINGNYDLVDEVKKSTGATATVFVKDGDDFVRVSTPLARAKAYESVKSGQGFCGDVDVLGTPYHACYNPIKDAAGSVIGVTYVGFKK